MEESPKVEWWVKVIAIITVIIFSVVFFVIVGAIQEGIRSSSWWQRGKACVEWRESFPDKRLIEIVRKDVDGQTLDQIGDFYGVSGDCVERRINEDRELFERLKAQYISRNY